LADKDGAIVGQTEVGKDELIDRMDFKFHHWNNQTRRPKKVLTLKSVNAEIKRGLLTHKELKELKCNFVHTTTLVHRKANLSLKKTPISDLRTYTTKCGDILLSRVGSIGKTSMVYRGRVPISDCIYRIRVEEKYRKKVWEALTSDKGQQWLHANAHGVCAKLLSKADLLNFPIE
jgi:type I restriction enzyme M protein